MTHPNADEDSTQIRQPSPSSLRNIPERYNASIVILSGFAEGMEYPITGEYTVIGRDKTADIAVKDPLVSRQHVAIVYHDGEFTIKDLGSTNGTVIGGKVVELAALQHKDKFRIGDTTIQFILQDTGEGRLYEISE